MHTLTEIDDADSVGLSIKRIHFLQRLFRVTGKGTEFAAPMVQWILLFASPCIMGVTNWRFRRPQVVCLSPQFIHKQNKKYNFIENVHLLLLLLECISNFALCSVNIMENNEDTIVFNLLYQLMPYVIWSCYITLSLQKNVNFVWTHLLHVTHCLNLPGTLAKTRRNKHIETNYGEIMKMNNNCTRFYEMCRKQ